MEDSVDVHPGSLWFGCGSAALVRRANKAAKMAAMRTAGLPSRAYNLPFSTKNPDLLEKAESVAGCFVDYDVRWMVEFEQSGWGW